MATDLAQMQYVIHIAHEKLRNVPQGPLTLRFSGINPDACPYGQHTAQSFAFTPHAQSGIKPLNEISVNFMPFSIHPCPSWLFCHGINAFWISVET